MAALRDDLRALFDAPNLAHLATLMPDGSPHSVPLWVGVEGDRIAFLTAPESRKARNIARDPRVSISIADADRPLTMGQVQGRVVERLDGARALELIDRLALKYTGEPFHLRSGRVIFLVEVEHAWAEAY
jgi:PPOX class probable F420-dependent enzyme